MLKKAQEMQSVHTMLDDSLCPSRVQCEGLDEGYRPIGVLHERVWEVSHTVFAHQQPEDVGYGDCILTGFCSLAEGPLAAADQQIQDSSNAVARVKAMGDPSRHL